MLRPHFSLFAPAADSAGSAGAGSPPPASSTPPPAAPAAPSADPAIKDLQTEWKSKEYADIAAHHTQLVQTGHLDEAAFFHKHVVTTFKSVKK